MAKGEPSPEATALAAYGIYLMNGGRKEDYMDLNRDDIQLIYTTYAAYQNQLIHRLTDIIVKIFGGQ